MIEQLNELADKIQNQPTTSLLTDYSRNLIFLAEELWKCRNYANKKKLEYKREYKILYAKVRDNYKSNTAANDFVGWELIDLEAAYKEAEVERDSIKDLKEAYINHMWTGKLDLESWKTAEVSVNSFNDESF